MLRNLTLEGFSGLQQVGQTIELRSGGIVGYGAAGRENEAFSGVPLGRLPLVSKAFFAQRAVVLLVEPTHEYSAVALPHPGYGDARTVG